jgi:hypothetical protein
VQAVPAKVRSSTLLHLRTPTRGPAALRVVAFREDSKQPLKWLESLKMKTNEARTVQRKGKQQLQKTRDTINRREWSSAVVYVTPENLHSSRDLRDCTAKEIYSKAVAGSFVGPITALLLPYNQGRLFHVLLAALALSWLLLLSSLLLLLQACQMQRPLLQATPPCTASTQQCRRLLHAWVLPTHSWCGKICDHKLHCYDS